MYLAFCSIVIISNIRLSSVCLMMINVFDRKLTFYFLNTSDGFLRLRPQIHNTVWYNILPKLIKIYNNRYYFTIKMKPIQVNKNNEKYVKENIYTYNKTSKNPKFKIGNLIRISLKRRNLFDKPSGNIKWSEELFKIHSINRSNVITYKIKDLSGEIIDGIFYEREFQKTKNTSEVYIIEKIIRKNKNKYLVKWRGYSNDFNSWVDKDDVVKYT